MKERRAHKRTRRHFAINIVAVDIGGRAVRFDGSKANPKFWDEAGLDFSPRGMKIMCSKPLPQEAKIQMKLLIPDAEQLNLVRANGTIKWFKQVKGAHKKYFIIGVHFRDLAEPDRAKIVRLWKKYG